MAIFVLSELSQNRTKNKHGTKERTQGLNINGLKFLKMFGQMPKVHLKCNALDDQECEHIVTEGVYPSVTSFCVQKEKQKEKEWEED